MTPAFRSMFRRIDHIGIIVSNLEEARPWLRDVFGLSLLETVDLPDGRIHGETYACGDVAIEVLEVGDLEIRRRRLGNGNRARIEHIAVEVDDLAASLAKLAALGVRITTPEPRRSGDSLNVWTVEETTGGISYQLIERTPEPPSAKRCRE